MATATVVLALFCVLTQKQFPEAVAKSWKISEKGNMENKILEIFDSFKV